MKRVFEEPIVEVVKYGVEDVITASSQGINLLSDETEIGNGQ